MERDITINAKMPDKIQRIIDASELLRQAETLHKILSSETCKMPLPETRFCREYGFNREDLLPAICQYFYEKGLNDKK